MLDRQAILITGGCGFIGCNLARRLVSEGVSVRVFDNLSRGSMRFIDGVGVEVVVGDVLEPDSIARAMKGIDRVIHLAAYGSVMESIENPLINFRINAQGTLNVLHAAHDAGVSRLVFASTGGAIMGDTPPPVDETSVPRPISPYGASKLCGEAYCQAYAGSFDLETIVLRFGNVYGPRSAHKKGAVTNFAKALLRDEPIEIFGDGSQSRDFLHVSDLCDGIVGAVTAPLPSPSTFHLASGVETTVRRLADLLIRFANKPDHPLIYRAARRGEVKRNFASSERARNELGFVTHYELEAGLRETWDWFLENPDEVHKAVESDA